MRTFIETTSKIFRYVQPPLIWSFGLVRQCMNLLKSFKKLCLNLDIVILHIHKSTLTYTHPKSFHTLYSFERQLTNKIKKKQEKGPEVQRRILLLLITAPGVQEQQALQSKLNFCMTI